MDGGDLTLSRGQQVTQLHYTNGLFHADLGLLEDYTITGNVLCSDDTTALVHVRGSDGFSKDLSMTQGKFSLSPGTNNIAGPAGLLSYYENATDPNGKAWYGAGQAIIGPNRVGKTKFMVKNATMVPGGGEMNTHGTFTFAIEGVL